MAVGFSFGDIYLEDYFMIKSISEDDGLKGNKLHVNTDAKFSVGYQVRIICPDGDCVIAGNPAKVIKHYKGKRGIR